MILERREIPDWAKAERKRDMGWIAENLERLWSAAQRRFSQQGRGAIIVDTSVRAPRAANPLVYLSETGVENMECLEALRRVKEYNPTWELVPILIKAQHRVSTNRLGVLFRAPANGPDPGPSQHPERKDAIVIVGRDAARTRYALVIQPFRRVREHRPRFGEIEVAEYIVPTRETNTQAEGLIDSLFPIARRLVSRERRKY